MTNMLKLSIILFVVVTAASVAIPTLRPMAIVIAIFTAIILTAMNIAFGVLIKQERAHSEELIRAAEEKAERLLKERERFDRFVESELERRTAEEGEGADGEPEEPIEKSE